MTWTDPSNPLRRHLFRAMALAWTVWVCFEVSHPVLPVLPRLTLFAGIGLCVVFLHVPPAPVFRHSRWAHLADLIFAAISLLTTVVCVVGVEGWLATAFGWLFFLLLLEGLRRTSGSTLAVLMLASAGALVYAGQPLATLARWPASPSFVAPLKVLFEAMFFFALLGAVLELFGAGDWLAHWARRLSGREPGATARLAVLTQALRGAITRSSLPTRAENSLIPRMKREGIPAELAAAIEAATTVGRSLIPPVLGAGAFLMLSTVEPQVSLLTIMKAALFPAFLFYFSLYLVARWRLRGLDLEPPNIEESATVELRLAQPRQVGVIEGILLAAILAALVVGLSLGFATHYAVLLALLFGSLLATCHSRTRATPLAWLSALSQAAAGIAPLVLAAAGIPWILAALELSQLGPWLGGWLLPMADLDLLPVLIVVMSGSLLVGMGMPAILAYLLPAMVFAPTLVQLGVQPLAAHFFIFYFGLLAVITPPVAPAVDHATAIARTPRWPTTATTLRLSLVGFTLPFLFVYRPQLLMLDHHGSATHWFDYLIAAVVALLGIFPLAGAESGYFGRPVGPFFRVLLLIAAALIFFPAAGPPHEVPISWVNLAGLGLLLALGSRSGWSWVGRTDSQL